MLENKKVFLFDMDGLLLDTERLHLKVWEDVFKQNHVDFDMRILEMTIGSSGKAAKAIMKRECGDENFLNPYREYKRTLFLEEIYQRGIPVKKGAKELLEYLRDSQYEIILVSSTHADDVNLYLEVSGLASFIEKRVCGNEVKESKPSPELYLKAIHDYHLNKDECIVFEDSYNGIKASHEAGLDVIGIPDLIDISQIHLSHLIGIYDSLEEILNIIKKQPQL